MKTLFLFLLTCIGINVSAASNNWGITRLPEDLTTDAHAVVRQHQQTIERTAADQLKTTVTFVVTVLNSKGRDASAFYLPFSKDTKVIQVSGRVLDASGHQIKAIKKKDFSDYSSFQDFIFYSDQRVLVYQPQIRTYPYTVEYTYTTQTKGLILIDLWTPVSGYNLAVEHASLRVITPNNLPISFRGQNHDFNYRTGELENGKTEHHWTIQGFTAIKKAPFGPDFLSLFPYLSIAPVNYNYDGFSETVNDWDSYGRWVARLLEDKQELPLATRDLMSALTDSLPDVKSKVKAVYQYMQKKTRYVCISEGIGGFQPVSALEVDQFGYGDCKALSNYTRALLTSINIPSFYTEIGADTRRIRHTDFASADQTNHVILTVPLGNDTVWLECTNPYNPFGYVGEAIANRYALAVTPDGGRLMTMPHYTAEDNVLEQTLVLKLNQNGDASAQMTSTAKGLRFEDYHFLSTGSSKQQKDYLLTNLPLKNLSIDQFRIDETGDENPQSSLSVEFKAEQYAQASGNRLVVPMNTISPLTLKVQDKGTREVDLQFGTTRTDVSRFVYELPPGFEIEFVPSETQIENDFLSYHTYCDVAENKLTFHRVFVLKKTNIPKEHYKDFVDALQKIHQLDSPKAILKQS